MRVRKVRKISEDLGIVSLLRETGTKLLGGEKMGGDWVLHCCSPPRP